MASSPWPRTNNRCNQSRALFFRLGIGPGNSLLGGIAVCFIPIPFIFYFVSPKYLIKLHRTTDRQIVW